MADIGMDSQLSNPPVSYSGNLPGTTWNEDLWNSLPRRGNITPEVIERLEKDLDFYEKVSLVFLLYKNADTALQFLKVAESAERNRVMPRPRLLFEWARSQAVESPVHWEDTFLEALCIVQNYRIVEKLGYQKNDVIERFLPVNPDIALNVNLIRKALYVMCERLDPEQSRRLVELVTHDLGSELPSWIRRAPDYLEMHILYWISQKHVVIRNREVNLTNITKHLKQMEEFNLMEYLESVAKRYVTYEINSDDQIADSDDQIADSNVITDNQTDHSVVSTFEMPRVIEQNMEKYHIDPKNVGLCVIINQKNFYEESNPDLKYLVTPDNLEVRTGTDKDRDSLIEAFENFGFTVKVCENLTHTDLLESVKNAVQRLVQENHSCFVLCILSHGERNAVYGVNSIAVSVEEIESVVHCRKLMGKPKIMIIQACQGIPKLNALPCNVTPSRSDVACDGPTHSKQTRPQVSDMLTLWSTVPGYASFRDRRNGSWFVQSLCDHLLRATVAVDMYDVAAAVNRSIQPRSAWLEGGAKSMQPQMTSTLGYRLILPCSRDARRTVARRMAVRHLFDDLLEEYLRREYARISSVPADQ